MYRRSRLSSTSPDSSALVNVVMVPNIKITVKDLLTNVKISVMDIFS